MEYNFMLEDLIINVQVDNELNGVYPCDDDEWIGMLEEELGRKFSVTEKSWCLDNRLAVLRTKGMTFSFKDD